MYANIEIKNGNFVSYDIDHSMFHPLPNQNELKEKVKKEAEEILKYQLDIETTKQIIYKALSKVLDCVIQVYFKTASTRESKDPLYLELEEYIYSLPNYQKLISSTRTLRINKSNFIISDINGIAMGSDICDIQALKEEIEKYTLKNKKQLKKNVILKSALASFFFVNRVTYIDYSNPTVIELLDYINNSNGYNNNLINSCRICFQNGSIKLKCQNEFFEVPQNVNVENLKKEIEAYIERNPKEFNLKTLITGSLESLSGFRALKTVSSYETVYVGKTKREILKEDPLYLSLVSFIEEMPDYQIRLKENQEKLRKRREEIKKGKMEQRQKTFVERLTFEGKEKPSKRPYYKRFQ